MQGAISGRAAANIVLLGSVAFVISACNSAKQPEPAYDGKPLSQWIVEASPVPDDQDPAADAVRRMGPAALPYLLMAFKTGKLPAPSAGTRNLQVWEVRDKVAEIMKGLGTNAAPLASAITEDLADQDERVRDKAAEILGTTGVLDQKVLRALLRALGDSECAFEASRSLARLGKMHTNVVCELANVTAGTDRTAAQWATTSLAYLGHRSAPALPALLKLARDESFDVRVSAVKALALIEPTNEVAISVLTEALRDQEVWVRKCAVIGLGRIGQPARSCVGELSAMLEKAEPYTRADIARALWRIQPEEPELPLRIAENLVNEGLHEISTTERIPSAMSSALFLLGEMGTNAAAALPAVIRAQRVDEPIIQFNAAWAACQMDRALSARTEELLKKIANVESYPLDPNLQYGGPVGKILAEPKRQRESYHIRVAAIGALWQLNTQSKTELRDQLANLLKEWTHWTSLKSPIPELQVLGPVLREIIADSSMAEVHPFAGKALDEISGSERERW